MTPREAREAAALLRRVLPSEVIAALDEGCGGRGAGVYGAEVERREPGPAVAREAALIGDVRRVVEQFHPGAAFSVIREDEGTFRIGVDVGRISDEFALALTSAVQGRVPGWIRVTVAREPASPTEAPRTTEEIRATAAEVLAACHARPPGPAPRFAIGMAAQADAAFGRELRVYGDAPQSPAPGDEVARLTEERDRLAAIVKRVEALRDRWRGGLLHQSADGIDAALRGTNT